MTVAPTGWCRGSVAAIAAMCTFAGVNALAGGAFADSASGGQQDEPHLTQAQRSVLLEARQFRNVERAVAAGYQPTEECVPGMGFHYGHPALAADANIDPTSPEILVYAPPGTPPMPVHNDLHVWLYRTNPAGELSPNNPEISCS